MDVKELARLVEQMRQAQRSYFRTRSAGDLENSRRLEKLVDRAAKEALEQQRMFN